MKTDRQPQMARHHECGRQENASLEHDGHGTLDRRVRIQQVQQTEHHG